MIFEALLEEKCIESKQFSKGASGAEKVTGAHFLHHGPKGTDAA